jgi:hypothetical protein
MTLALKQSARNVQSCVTNYLTKMDSRVVMQMLALRQSEQGARMTDRELLEEALHQLSQTLGYSDEAQERLNDLKRQIRRRLDEPAWVELTSDEGAEIWADCHDIEWKRLVPPKEIVKRISDKLKEKNR